MSIEGEKIPELKSSTRSSKGERLIAIRERATAIIKNVQDFPELYKKIEEVAKFDKDFREVVNGDMIDHIKEIESIKDPKQLEIIKIKLNKVTMRLGLRQKVMDIFLALHEEKVL